MSGHFVFPPSQHENLPLEPENSETHNEQGGEEDAVPDEGGRSGAKDDENWNVKGLTESVDFPGIQVFDDKGNIEGREFEEGMALQGLNSVDKDQSIYSAAEFGSFHSEATIGGSTIGEENRVANEPIEHYDEDLDSSDTSCLAKPVDDNDVTDGPEIPSEAWWKKRAASLYAHAKEANTFWSIFIAAAVMGLVIIGQHWQQERWQVLQLKFNDEMMGKMLGPLSRFKDAIVGGTRRGSLIRGSTTSTQR